MKEKPRPVTRCCRCKKRSVQYKEEKRGMPPFFCLDRMREGPYKEKRYARIGCHSKIWKTAKCRGFQEHFSQKTRKKSEKAGRKCLQLRRDCFII